MPGCRLIEVIHADRRLFLVFEFLDLDLKKHLDTNPLICGDKKLIKVTIGLVILIMRLMPSSFGLYLIFTGLDCNGSSIAADTVV